MLASQGTRLLTKLPSVSQVLPTLASPPMSTLCLTIAASMFGPFGPPLSSLLLIFFLLLFSRPLPIALCLCLASLMFPQGFPSPVILLRQPKPLLRAAPCLCVAPRASLRRVDLRVADALVANSLIEPLDFEHCVGAFETCFSARLFPPFGGVLCWCLGCAFSLLLLSFSCVYAHLPRGCSKLAESGLTASPR